MFIDERIVEEFLDYPAIFCLVIEGLPNTSVQLYIGWIDCKIYLVQNYIIEYHDNKKWSASIQMEWYGFCSLFNINMYYFTMKSTGAFKSTTTSNKIL